MYIKTKEKVQEFYDFLRGKSLPDGITMAMPKLSKRKAFNVIWMLQERYHLISSNYELCKVCDMIFDSENEGYYDGINGGGWCDNCKGDKGYGNE